MFFHEVPQELRANIAYRIKIRERAAKDLGFRRAMWQACKEDVLFFFSAFCWLYEPRKRFYASGREKSKIVPFIPWEHQIEPILTLRRHLGTDDVVVFKSRGEGLSWIGVLMALDDWLFDDMAKVGLVSNTEKKADDPGNMDSLFAKIDWELARLPLWMAGERDNHWKRNLSDHSLVNHRNGSQINAFAATGDAGRSGRYKWFMADELAFWDRGKDRDFMTAVRESTESRLSISTPNGTSGVFYDMVHVPSSVVPIRIHWSSNPSKNRGLYRLVDNVPVAVDPINNPLLPGYDPPSQKILDRWSRLRLKGFKLDADVRSDWYDAQCDRADATPQSVAQELDLDFGGSMHRVFTAEFFEKADATIQQPKVMGNVSYHPETFEMTFGKSPNGELRLWLELDEEGRPPKASYVVTCDISSGLGGSHTSNSVLMISNSDTREQVGQFASNTIEPSMFGELAVVISKWFHNAYLGWEANYGGGFTKRVKDLGYGNIYYRTQHWKRSKQKTKEIGWWTDERSKDMMFSDLHRMVMKGEFTIRDGDLLKECGEYIRTGSQSKIEHVLSLSTTDDSSKGKAHGDRVIAMCIGVQLCKDRPAYTEDEDTEEVVEPDTLAARVRQWKAEEEEDAEVWDSRTTADLCA